MHDVVCDEQPLGGLSSNLLGRGWSCTSVSHARSSLCWVIHCRTPFLLQLGQSDTALVPDFTAFIENRPSRQDVTSFLASIPKDIRCHWQ